VVQSLLEDRFNLALHHETRQLPIYALVLSKAGKTGPQLILHSGDAKCADPAADRPPKQPGRGESMPAFCGGFFMNLRPGDLREIGNKITMAMLAPFLIQSVDRTVVDRTGLTGVFDFTLEFAPELGPDSQPDNTSARLIHRWHLRSSRLCKSNWASSWNRKRVPWMSSLSITWRNRRQISTVSSTRGFRVTPATAENGMWDSGKVSFRKTTSLAARLIHYCHTHIRWAT
jgi:uncharacterized protein DUF3738